MQITCKWHANEQWGIDGFPRGTIDGTRAEDRSRHRFDAEAAVKSPANKDGRPSPTTTTRTNRLFCERIMQRSACAMRCHGDARRSFSPTASRRQKGLRRRGGEGEPSSAIDRCKSGDVARTRSTVAPPARNRTYFTRWSAPRAIWALFTRERAYARPHKRLACGVRGDGWSRIQTYFRPARRHRTHLSEMRKSDERHRLLPSSIAW